jgi:hypothetical protein
LVTAKWAQTPSFFLPSRTTKNAGAMRNTWMIFACMLALAACTPHVRTPEPEAEVVPIEPAPPTSTRGAFDIEADKLDTWNAIGQIVVRTPGVAYEGRSQMLDLYTVRYRGVSFLLLTRSLLLDDTIKKTTTRVTATTPNGKPIDDDASADLLALLQRARPAEIEVVRARQAAEAKAKKAKAQKSKKKKKK